VSPPQSARRLFQNGAIYAAGDLGLKALTALFLPILTFYLTPQEVGLWSLALTLVAALSTLFNLALHGAVTRFFYDFEGPEHRARRRAFMGTVLTWLLCWGAACALALYWVGPQLLAVWSPSFPFWPYGGAAIAIAALGALGSVPQALWAAEERPRLFVGVSALGTTLDVVGSLSLVVVFGLGVWGLVWGRLLSAGVLALVFLGYSLREIGLAWRPEDLRRALRFSLPLVPHLMAHWALGMADRVMIERYYEARPHEALALGWGGGEGAGLFAVGLYSVGYTFIGLLNTASVSMNRAWVPQFTRLYQRALEGDVGGREALAASITHFLWVVYGVGLALAFVGPVVVRWGFSPEYAPAASLVAPLCVGGLLQGIYYVYVAVVFFHKDNRLIPVVTVVSGLLNVALNALWLPRFGLLGAAWATVVGYGVLCGGAWWAGRRYGRLPFEGRVRWLSWGVGVGALGAVGAGGAF
jgi:O-antigen/teichoic acid export membrane protein